MTDEIIPIARRVAGLDVSLTSLGMCRLDPIEGAPLGVRLSHRALQWPPGERPRAPRGDAEYQAREDWLLREVRAFCAGAELVVIEDYAFSKRVGAHALAGFTEEVKRTLRRAGLRFVTVASNRARKQVLGSSPTRRKEEEQGVIKEKVAELLKLQGMTFPTSDEADAYVLAKWGMEQERLRAHLGPGAPFPGARKPPRRKRGGKTAAAWKGQGVLIPATRR